MSAKYSSTLNSHIAALIAAGYEVTFAAGTDPDAFWVHLDKKDDLDAGRTAGGKTIPEALWAASPLHGDDEPYPGEELVPAEEITDLLTLARAQGYRAGREERAGLDKVRAVIKRAEDELRVILAEPAAAE